ncbi:hypothetical protein V2W45_1246697, partial [Cenococcum geophilum]
FLEGEFLRISIKYCRFIFKEIIYIYIGLEEAQLQFITRLVFNALNYLRKLGILYYRVSLILIYISSQDSSIYYTNFNIANFKEAVKYAPNVILNTNLEDLGFILLAYIKRRP